MKFLVAITCLLLLTPAWADDDERLAKSLETWTRLKAECEGNYSYKVFWSSFSGSANETEIIVRANFVRQRRFREFGGPGQKEPNQWKESGTQLGDHRNGAPPLTLDQLYVDAKAVLAREMRPDERRYLKFDRKGLLLSCFTIDTRIADDSPKNGVNIATILLDAGKPTQGKTPAPEKKPTVYKSPGGKAYPTHWGAPPRIQTRDHRRLPGGYGAGSSTLANWILDHIKQDAANTR